MSTILVTGAAGFIGYHCCRALLANGFEVLGIDSLSDYYSPAYKRRRLEPLLAHPGFTFSVVDIADADALSKSVVGRDIHTVVNLAAQAGVRMSLKQPSTYVQSNLVGFCNVLELVREQPDAALVYASSSSVSGLGATRESHGRGSHDHPTSLYAATKRSNELLAHTYSLNFGIPTTGLRLFSVYGPWGRPDMAILKFARRMLRGESIPVFDAGRGCRDWTYVEDVVEGILTTIQSRPEGCADWLTQAPNPMRSSAPFRLYNLGRGDSIPLTRVIELLETNLELKADLNVLPAQAGDVQYTCADLSDGRSPEGYRPTVDLEEGIRRFSRWLLDNRWVVDDSDLAQ